MLVSWLRAAPAILLCFAACNFDEGGVGGDTRDGAVADGPVAPVADASVIPDGGVTIDGDPVRPDATVLPDASTSVADAGGPDASCPGDVLSVTPSNFGKCDVVAPISDVTLSNGSYIINTGNNTLRKEGDATAFSLNASVVAQTGAPDLVIWSVRSITIEATSSLTIQGERPLAIVSFGNISIAGGLLANATFQTPGPGGSPAAAGARGFCNTGTGGPGVIQSVGDAGNDSGTGGGGGGYGKAGGHGAKVVQSPGAPVAAGATNGNAQLVPLRGGCGGGAGGNGGGAGGAGGGAIQLVASGTLSVGITGRIIARGGGGRGSPGMATGGAGGGSGGAILLEAPTVAVDGDLAANGGAGAEGTSGGGMTFFGEDGENGSNGDTAAAGGNRGGFGGNGGDGGHRSNDAQDGNEGMENADPPSGGGGGGGAVGRIRINAGTVTTGITSTITPQETRG